MKYYGESYFSIGDRSDKVLLIPHDNMIDLLQIRT